MWRTWLKLNPTATWEKIQEVVKSPAISISAFKAKGILNLYSNVHTCMWLAIATYAVIMANNYRNIKIRIVI